MPAVLWFRMGLKGQLMGDTKDRRSAAYPRTHRFSGSFLQPDLAISWVVLNHRENSRTSSESPPYGLAWLHSSTRRRFLGCPQDGSGFLEAFVEDKTPVTRQGSCPLQNYIFLFATAVPYRPRSLILMTQRFLSHSFEQTFPISN